MDSDVPLALTAKHTSTRGTQHTQQTARGQQPTQRQHSVDPCLWYQGPCSVLILLSLGATSRRMCHLCEIRRLVGYWLRTCFYSYNFLFSVSAALLADHRHTQSRSSTSTAVTTRTAINSAIPQGTRFYRDLCTTPFGIASRWEDILSKDAAFVPSSNHLVRATLPCGWWAATGIRTPRARTLAHGKHPTAVE